MESYCLVTSKAEMKEAYKKHDVIVVKGDIAHKLQGVGTLSNMSSNKMIAFLAAAGTAIVAVTALPETAGISSFAAIPSVVTMSVISGLTIQQIVSFIFIGLYLLLDYSKDYTCIDRTRLGEEEVVYVRKNCDVSKLNFDKILKNGDVLSAKRMLQYRHYGIYVGNGEIVHFASETGDWGDDILIHKAPIVNFCKNNKKIEILDFKNKHGNCYFNVRDGLVRKKVNCYVYSGQETAGRALSIAEEVEKGIPREEFKKKYNLFTNNCEHFALWCKLGVKDSKQVDNIIDTLLKGILASTIKMPI